MKSKLLATSFFLFILFQETFSQAILKLDTTSFDFGQVIQGPQAKKDFYFTNIGNEPLIISYASTSDGGSMASYPKEPIAPGKGGKITFYQNTQGRIGLFTKSISIGSNSKQQVIIVKGEVIYERTEIAIPKKEIDFGEIYFQDIDTVSFNIKNIGNAPLHITPAKFNYHYPEDDILWYKMETEKEEPKNPGYYGTSFLPNAEIKISLLLQNIYGDVGRVNQTIVFVYNSHDTLLVTLKGKFVGKPEKEQMANGGGKWGGVTVFNYKNNKLAKRSDYAENGGSLMEESFYDGIYCTHSILYGSSYGNKQTEYYFEKGKLIKESVLKTE